jgi:hypothetical protein
MRRLLAGLLTLVFVGLMAWSALRRAGAPDPAGDGPAASDPPAPNRQADGAADCIERLINSAQTGDVGAYLSAFAPPLRARLEREAAERGPVRFGARLREAAQARKSHAVYAPEPDGPGSSSVRITVESTYAGRLERQNYRLERTAAGWQVTAVETAHQEIPAHLPGAFANYEEPEGVPVPIAAKDN